MLTGNKTGRPGVTEQTMDGEGELIPLEPNIAQHRHSDAVTGRGSGGGGIVLML